MLVLLQLPHFVGWDGCDYMRSTLIDCLLLLLLLAAAADAGANVQVPMERIPELVQQAFPGLVQVTRLSPVLFLFTA